MHAGEERRTRQGSEELWKGGDGPPKMGGTAQRCGWEPKPGISPGKAPAPGTLGKMDERASETKQGTVISPPPAPQRSLTAEGSAQTAQKELMTGEAQGTAKPLASVPV